MCVCMLLCIFIRGCIYIGVTCPPFDTKRARKQVRIRYINIIVSSRDEEEVFPAPREGTYKN